MRVTEGVDSFKGEIFHSSQWRHDISLQRKKVVVVGNGCSATQLVPKIAVEAESVTQFIRSQHVSSPQIMTNESMSTNVAIIRIQRLLNGIRLHNHC